MPDAGQLEAFAKLQSQSRNGTVSENTGREGQD